MILRHVIRPHTGSHMSALLSHKIGHHSAARLGGGSSFLCFGLPSSDNVASDGKEVVGRNEGGGGDGGVLVDDGGFEVAFYGLHGRGLFLSSWLTLPDRRRKEDHTSIMRHRLRIAFAL